MRRSLGLTPASAPSSPTVASPSNDPMKVARQAIRAQAAARDYAERHLAQAQAAVQDLSQKLRQARHDKDAAVEHARSAIAARSAAERTLAATESALAVERASRERGDRALKEAQATIRELRDMLETAGQEVQRLKAERAQQDEARRQKEDRMAVTAAPSLGPIPGGDASVPKRGRGRPRKIVQPLTETASVKIASATHMVFHKPAKSQAPRKAYSQDQEPVQWWLNKR